MLYQLNWFREVKIDYGCVPLGPRWGFLAVRVVRSKRRMGATARLVAGLASEESLHIGRVKNYAIDLTVSVR